jgi:predicted DNA-binding transcriptional regulator AlpA
MRALNNKRMKAASSSIKKAYRRLFADGDKYGLCDELEKAYLAISAELEEGSGLLEALEQLIRDCDRFNISHSIGQSLYRANCAIYEATGACSHGVTDGACKECYMYSATDDEPLIKIDADERFLTTSAVENMVGLRRVSIWKLVKQGRFPSPIKIENKTNRYRLSEVVCWMQHQANKSINKGSAK